MTKDLSNCSGCVYENAYKEPWPWHTCGKTEIDYLKPHANPCDLSIDPDMLNTCQKHVKTVHVEPTQKLGWEEEFDTLLQELQRDDDFDEYGTSKASHKFGMRLIRRPQDRNPYTETFTIADWGNLKAFIRKVAKAEYERGAKACIKIVDELARNVAQERISEDNMSHYRTSRLQYQILQQALVRLEDLKSARDVQLD